MSGDKRYESRLGVRCVLLGDAHVDRSIANRTGFTAEFQ